MTAGREIEGVSVPFAAGVAAGFLLCSLFSGFAFHAFSASLTMISAVLAILAISRFDSRTTSLTLKIATATMFLLTGLFCAFQSSILEGIPAQSNPVSRIAADAVGHLRSAIDSIPYGSASTAPLVKALLTGDRSGLDKETINIFRVSGASHILALSGLHLGVIYLIIIRLLAPFGHSRRASVLKYCIVVGTSLFYSIMTGAAPSIVRAFLFILIGETIKLSGRKRDSLRVLLVALTIQLALKPDVITSVGFQLSYLAMAGIFILYPPLERMYPDSGNLRWDRINPMKRIWKAGTLSISCQIFTAPVVWYHFHSFPKYFLITNLIALPLTSAIMVLSVATIALSVAGICPDALVKLNDLAVQSLVYCLKVISELDGPLCI